MGQHGTSATVYSTPVWSAMADLLTHLQRFISQCMRLLLNVQYSYYSTHILTFFSFLLFYLFSDMFLILRQLTLTDVRQSVVLIMLREVEAHLFTIL